MSTLSNFKPFGPRSAAHHLTRAVFANVHAAALGDVHRGGVIGLLASLYPDDHKAAALLTRGAVSPTDTTAAGALAQAAVGDFIASLQQSAAAKLFEAGNKASLDGIATLAFPRKAAAAGGDLPWVREGGAIAVRQFNLDAVVLGPAKKFGIIATMTREVAAHQSTFETLLREEATATLDAALFGDAAADDDRPAGLLNGVTPLAGSAAASMNERMIADLELLAGTIIAAGGIDVVYIASPRQAMSARLRLGTAKATIWASSALADGTVIAIEPQAFVSAFGANPKITASMQTAIHMDDAATALAATGTPNTVSAPARSLFQTDTIALKLILDAAWALRAAGRVQVITDATWGAAA